MNSLAQALCESAPKLASSLSISSQLASNRPSECCAGGDRRRGQLQDVDEHEDAHGLFGRAAPGVEPEYAMLLSHTRTHTHIRAHASAIMMCTIASLRSTLPSAVPRALLRQRGAGELAFHQMHDRNWIRGFVGTAVCPGMWICEAIMCTLCILLLQLADCTQ